MKLSARRSKKKQEQQGAQWLTFCAIKASWAEVWRTKLMLRDKLIQCADLRSCAHIAISTLPVVDRWEEGVLPSKFCAKFGVVGEIEVAMMKKDKRERVVRLIRRRQGAAITIISPI